MKKINRKLARDLWSSKGLFTAVIIIIFLAVSFFGSMFMAYQNLSNSYNYTYENLNFADLTVKVAEDASGAEDQLKAINGIEAVTGRMNADYALTLPGEQTSKVLVRAISLPSSESVRADTVNDVYIQEGTYFPDRDGNFILLEQNFAKHHELEPGQTVTMDVNNQDISFEIAGIATSPEYVFFAKSRQELLVSPEVWGVVFVPETIRNSLLNGPVNEFCFSFGDSVDAEGITSEIESILSEYTIMDIVPKEDQASYAGLETDLEQFEVIAEMFPALFIIVGAMAIYILLTRIVYNQRSQIGLMKAVGYSSRSVMIHYLGFATAVGLIGSITGSISGYYLAEAITKYYASMINLPFITTEVQWTGIITGFILGLVPCLIAGIVPAWRAARIVPAEAMHAPAPAAGRKLLLERIFPFVTRLSSLWKIPLRNIFRNRRRSLYTTIGIVFGVSLILVSAGMIDSMQDMIRFMFNDIQRYDARIEFASPQSSDLADEAQYWQGVKTVEPTLLFPARLQHNSETYSTICWALPNDAKLRGLYSPSEKPVSLNEDGIWLSQALGDTLDIGKGDILNLQTDWGTAQLPVIGFVKEPMGSFGYMSIDRARSEFGGLEIISGMLLEIDDDYADEIREKAYGMGAASVEITSETRERIDEMMEAGLGMLLIMLLFGAILSMAIVFTTVTINILERRREIATMRTLGESKRRIDMMVTIENLILGLAGLVPGIVMGYLLAWYFFSLFQGDMFSMDLIILPRTYILTVGIVIAIMLISQAPSIRTVNRLNLAQVTKEQAS